MAFVCSLCHQFASPTFRGVFKHIGIIHSFEPNFKVTCGISGCEATFTVYSSWRSHIYRKHRNEMLETSTIQEPEEVSNTFCNSLVPRPAGLGSRRTAVLTIIFLHVLQTFFQSNGVTDTEPCSMMAEMTTDFGEHNDMNVEEEDLMRICGLFIMKTRDERKLTQVWLPFSKLCSYHDTKGV